ncbi:MULTISPECIES: hypothetical protein [Bradyrhizobium]|jgi:hypothetical protein|uniref:hypothetical protein n=1 Tax=Bradyrhizobium TaxID=374 RepID=UPI00047F9B65|nr:MULTISPECIES: hypothetical protein [Bradyrhizobium]MCS3447604.1 hypothetical protein [Bradyrhizobium elkanii]MCS3561257.1 hypothetical protein [Bradyrhizobium elkanii]MCW2148900.1 hypothetical protein [Bradyrhizobium elkanii]MCW2352012.1 hypothetical protein [Bradyrhizobium elkanii]MCW2372629.1 hypothetical protein [Bradyrhizobium elkanii]
MNKTSLQDGVSNGGGKLASSTYGLSDGDPAYIGYWSRGEVLRFLESLLEGERAGIGAFACVGRSIKQHLADLMFESELAQAAICVLLKKEMIRKGGAHMVRRRRAAAASDRGGIVRNAVAFARAHQAGLADMIEDAVVNIFDSRLNAKLMYLLLLHRKQVEFLDTIDPAAANGSPDPHARGH